MRKRIVQVMAGVTTVCLVSGQILTTASAMTIQGGTSIAGFNDIIDEYYDNLADQEGTRLVTELFSADSAAPEGIAVANVTSGLNIRKGAGTGYALAGSLKKNSVCIVESIDENGWAKVVSGEVSGYCSARYLIMGTAATEKIKEVYKLMAVVNSDVTALNVRAEADSSSKLLGQVKAGESFVVTNEIVVNKNDEVCKTWVEIEYIKNKKTYKGYISANYCNVGYIYEYALKMTDYGLGVSDKRVKMLDYAKQFIGTPYLWGGNSLTKGVDCSGFIKQLYAYIGYSLPRVSTDIANVGTEISLADAVPGDIIVYGDREGNINHVAIYIGDGKIIQSSSTSDGVAIVNVANGMSLIKVVSLIKD